MKLDACYSRVSEDYVFYVKSPCDVIALRLLTWKCLKSHQKLCMEFADNNAWKFIRLYGDIEVFPNPSSLSS